MVYLSKQLDLIWCIINESQICISIQISVSLIFKYFLKRHKIFGFAGRDFAMISESSLILGNPTSIPVQLVLIIHCLLISMITKWQQQEPILSLSKRSIRGITRLFKMRGCRGRTQTFQRGLTWAQFGGFP